MKTKVFRIIVALGMILTIVSCSKAKWDGTWSTDGGKIMVTLNSSTMRANVRVMLGDEPITYTTNWEYIDGGIIYSDYAPNQATIIKNDGSMYGYNALTGQITDRGIKMHKR